MSNKISRTLVDNWLLGLAFQITSGQWPPLTWVADKYYSDSASSKRDAITSLLHLLDLIVINDELIYDAEFAWIWRDFESAEKVLPILSPIKLGEETKRQLSKSLISDTMQISLVANQEEIKRIRNEHQPVPDLFRLQAIAVQEGAINYLNLGRFLGIYYWPSPERAQFLSQAVQTLPHTGFIKSFNKYIDNSIQEIVNEALAPIEPIKLALDFPGFGSSILASCETRQSILSTAMQFRNTKECIAFRNWLREMDGALQTGNLKIVIENIKSVNEVIANVRSGLVLKTESPSTPKIELQIGISPSLNFGTDVFEPFVDRFIPKPYHIVFLRSHLWRMLSSANIQYSIERLFPQT